MSDSDLCPLGALVGLVNQAICDYQNNPVTGEVKLPLLRNAVFEFKTTAKKTTGFSVDLFIFKFGSSHEKDVVNDVKFTYKASNTTGTTEAIEHSTVTTENDLTATIKAAALALSKSPTVAGLPFDQLVITLQFGVTWQVGASGSWTYSFVTVGLSGSKNTNTLQTVTLTFS
jgi:hypothetical protein